MLQFCDAFFSKSKSNAAISNICKPAVERWQKRYNHAIGAYKEAKDMFERVQNFGDPVVLANAENSLKECTKAKDELEIFKKDLGTFVRFYEFMSQIVDYDDKELEKLSLYARNLRPLLREAFVEEDDIDLGNVELSHYRLTAIRQQHIKLNDDAADYALEPGDSVGSAKPKDKKAEFLSQIIDRLNEIFVTDELTEKDLVNYAYTISGKMSENMVVMSQVDNNSPEQAMLGDFQRAVDDAIMDSGEAHQNQMLQLMSNPDRARDFSKLIFELLKAGR